MPKIIPYVSKMCSNNRPYIDQGTYIGYVLSSRGEWVYVIERPDGQTFTGVKGSVSVIEQLHSISLRVIPETG